MEYPNQAINKWNIEDRPREKLLTIGKQHLRNDELLAILIGSGSAKKSAVELCAEVLEFVNNDLSQLSKLDVDLLCSFKGIGKAKAISIIAALELGRRRQAEQLPVKSSITSSKNAYLLLMKDLCDKPNELFVVAYLNKSNKLIKKNILSEGGIDGTFVDIRILFKKALDLFATNIIVAHNHPSGNLKPSKKDIALTKKIIDAGKILNISLLDHLIISQAGYYSFADEGLL